MIDTKLLLAIRYGTLNFFTPTSIPQQHEQQLQTNIWLFFTLNVA
jgi:hypothetical protein